MMDSLPRRFYFLFFFLFTFSICKAQFPPGGSVKGRPTLGDPTRNPRGAIGVDTFSTEPDSIPLPKFKYQYVHVDDLNKIIIEKDTTLGYFFQEIEPLKKRNFNYLSTTNYGAGGIPSYFQFKPHYGFSSGYTQYDVYNYTLDSVKIFDSNRTLADLFFSPIFGSQENFFVGANYGQQYKDGLSLSLNYKRASNRGFYTDQNTLTTNAALALRWKTRNDKMNFILGILNNTNNENHNGGVDTSALFISGNQYRLNVPVKLNQAATRYDYKDVFLITDVALDKKSLDSSKFTVGHKFIYKYGYNKFYDISVIKANDSLIYRSYLNDSRGIRNQLDISKVSNEIFIKSNWNFARGRVSLLHDYYSIIDGKTERSVNDVTARFNGVFKLGKSINIQTNANLGLGANVGNFVLTGKSIFGLGKIAGIMAEATFFNSNVPYLDENLTLNNEALYNVNLSNTLGSIYGGSLYSAKLNLELSVKQSLINNFIYRDALGLPTQLNDVFVNTQFSIIHKLKVYKFHLENIGFLQLMNKDILPLPKYSVKSNFYIESNAFKNALFFRFGVEGRYMPEFFLPQYDPVQGQYYKGRNSYKAEYLSGDLYFLGQVSSRFRVMFKMENIQQNFTNKINYLTVFHPQNDPKLRVIFSWLLLD
jgi:hypothetical protein